MAEASGDFRQAAREAFREACGRLGDAFNSRGDGAVPFRYSQRVRTQAVQLCGELMQLIEHGVIETNAAHAQWLQAQEAQRDPALQTLIRRASQKTLIRAAPRTSPISTTCTGWPAR